MKELAQARQKRDMEELDGNGFYFDPGPPERVKAFFERHLRHYKGEWAGQPVVLEDWQYEDIIKPVFGWFHEDGTRRYREAYIEVPRKNGKTLMAAGIGLYLMLPDGEPASEVYSAATKKDQAKLVWSDARQMVKMNAALSDLITVRRSNMHHVGRASKFEPLGADSNTLDGLNPHGVIIDELHAHRDRRVYDVLTTAYGARRNPLTWIITTAGVYDPETIGWQKHDHAMKVLQGDIEDDSFFAYVACADKEDDPYDPETWEKANPNYGISVKPRYLEEQAKKARQQPSFHNSFLRYHLNRWTQTRDRWIDSTAWDDCGGHVDVEALEGRKCWAGLDMSSTQDLSAFVLCFPPEDHDTGDWIIVPHFWLPENRAAERDSLDGTTYAKWVRQGYIATVPGSVLLDDPIMDGIIELADRFAVQEVWYDPYTANRFAAKLTDWYGIETVQCRQGAVTMNEPCQQFERLVYSGRLKHGDDPVLRWMSSNVTIYMNSNGLIKPDRKASREKIDGIVAAVMAVGAASVGEGDISVYDDREPMELIF